MMKRDSVRSMYIEHVQLSWNPRQVCLGLPTILNLIYKFGGQKWLVCLDTQ